MHAANATVEQRNDNRFADRQTLQSISWTMSGIAGTGNLSPRARRLLQLYVSLVRLTYGGLIAPLGAVSDTLARVLDGGSSSIRTIQRANKELSAANFIFIYQSRTKFCRIKFNLEAFSYWTATKSHKISPLITNTHNVVSRETFPHSSPHATKSRPEDRTNIQSVVNLRNIPDLNKKQRAGARAVCTNYKERKNPVLFSLLMVLRRATDLHACDRRRARMRAQCEVTAVAGGVSLVNPSGVDWEYWSRSWPEMSIAVRESTILREVLPLLLGNSGGGEQESRSYSPPPPPTEEHVWELPSTPTSEEINKMVKLLGKFIEPENTPKPIAAPLPLENKLSAEEFEILDRARRRARGER